MTNWWEEAKDLAGDALDVLPDVPIPGLGATSGQIADIAGGVGPAARGFDEWLRNQPWAENLGQGAIDAWKDIREFPVYEQILPRFETAFGRILHGASGAFGMLPEDARAEFNAANVNPYDEAGRFRAEGQRELAERQVRDYRIIAEAEDAAGWASLMARTRGGSAGRTVIDEAKLGMQQAAIEDTLMRGMAQIESQYQMMTDELTRQQDLAADEIQRARLAALDSMTQLQQDLQQRSNQAQGDIMQSVGRTGGSIAAATQEALSRLGTTSGVVSEGIRRSLEEEGQVERGLAASQGDIQADLAARLGQISQGALDRQQGLVETQASGSSAELANLVAQITAQRESERTATEFELSEGARQQVLDLMLNPPTKKVGGRAAGDLNKYALELEVLQGLGVPPAAALAAIVAGKEGDVIESYVDPQFNEEAFAREALAQASPEQQDAAMTNYLEGIIENPTAGMFGPR